MVSHDKVYRFGEFTLNSAKRRLTDEAAEVKLRDKDLDVLVYLLENAPKTCAHDEIIEHVWKDTNVENSSLEKAIANVRRALKDDARDPRFIKKVRSRGYLFIGDLAPVTAAEPAEVVDAGPLPEPQSVTRDVPKRPRYGMLIAGLIGVLIIGGVIGWKGSAIMAVLTQKVIFTDDFAAAELDKARWQAEGESVTVADGKVRLFVEKTDHWGRLKSVYFPFDRNRPVTIRSRAKVMYSQNLKDRSYFHGYFALSAKTSQEDADVIVHTAIFGVKYCNYDYESKYADGSVDEQKAEGFYLVAKGGDPTKKIDYQDHKVGPRISPKWNEWFDQTLVYDPISGKLSYFIDGEPAGALNVGAFETDLAEDKLRIEINPEGWWLYHSIDLDYVEVTQ